MQIIVGIFIFAIVLTLLVTFWKLILGIIVGAFIVGYIANKNSEGMAEKEKNDKIGSYLGYYSLFVFIFLIGACMSDVDLKSVDTSKKNVQQVETAKVDKTSEPVKHQNFSDDEQKFYELKFNEYVSAGIDKKSADERALANLNGLRKCIENVNNLSGDEKNIYGSKFQEYINSGIEKNSAIEKAYDDVREIRLKQEYEKRELEKEAEEEEKQRIFEERVAEQAERERNYSYNDYNEVVSYNYIGNANSGKFHYAGCRWASKISSYNRVYFSYRGDAISQGYVPCKVCSP